MARRPMGDLFYHQIPPERDLMKKIIAGAEFVMYWSLICIPFSVAVGSAITNILIGFSIFSFLVKTVLKKERLCEHKSVLVALSCMFAVALVSFRNTIDLRASIQGLEKMLLAIFLFFIASRQIADKKHLKRVVLSCIAGAAFAAFDALWQMVFGFDFIRHNPPMIYISTLRRATAGFSHTNMLGIYLTASAPLAIGLGRYYYQGKKKIFLSCIAVLIAAGIALTYSRGALAGLLISVLFLAIFRKDKLVLTALILALSAAPFLLPKDVKYFARTVNYNPVRFMLNDDRISMFKNAANMIKHHPFVGVGVNTFCKNYKKYKLLGPSYALTGDSMYAHNNFLHMGGEIGLLGLSSFLWFLFLIFKFSRRIYLRVKDNFLKVSSLSLNACVIAFLINGLTETSLYNAKVAVMFWFLAGLTLSIGKIKEE